MDRFLSKVKVMPTSMQNSSVLFGTAIDLFPQRAELTPRLMEEKKVETLTQNLLLWGFRCLCLEKGQFSDPILSEPWSGPSQSLPMDPFWVELHLFTLETLVKQRLIHPYSKTLENLHNQWMPTVGLVVYQYMMKDPPRFRILLKLHINRIPRSLEGIYRANQTFSQLVDLVQRAAFNVQPTVPADHTVVRSWLPSAGNVSFLSVERPQPTMPKRQFRAEMSDWDSMPDGAFVIRFFEHFMSTRALHKYKAQDEFTRRTYRRLDLVVTHLFVNAELERSQKKSDYYKKAFFLLLNWLALAMMDFRPKPKPEEKDQEPDPLWAQNYGGVWNGMQASETILYLLKNAELSDIKDLNLASVLREKLVPSYYDLLMQQSRPSLNDLKLLCQQNKWMVSLTIINGLIGQPFSNFIDSIPRKNDGCLSPPVNDNSVRNAPTSQSQIFAFCQPNATNTPTRCESIAKSEPVTIVGVCGVFFHTYLAKVWKDTPSFIPQPISAFLCETKERERKLQTVMQRMEMSVAEFLDRFGFLPEGCIQAMFFLASRLTAQGIVHGDLKPDQFLLSGLDQKEVTVSLTDFGYSGWIDTNASETTRQFPYEPKIGWLARHCDKRYVTLQRLHKGQKDLVRVTPYHFLFPHRKWINLWQLHCSLVLSKCVVLLEDGNKLPYGFPDESILSQQQLHIMCTGIPVMESTCRERTSGIVSYKTHFVLRPVTLSFTPFAHVYQQNLNRFKNRFEKLVFQETTAPPSLSDPSLSLESEKTRPRTAPARQSLLSASAFPLVHTTTPVPEKKDSTLDQKQYPIQSSEYEHVQHSNPYLVNNDNGPFQGINHGDSQMPSLIPSTSLVQRMDF